MDIITKLSAVLNTLGGVEVKGRDNLDRVLGCIQTVEDVLRLLTRPPAPTAEPDTPKQEPEVV